MLVSTPGTLGGGASFPPAGTLLASACGSPDNGPGVGENYSDANGNTFFGSFTLFQEFADGAGGSYWVNSGNNHQDTNAACWYPAYFYDYNTFSGQNFAWGGCGQTGSFEYGATNNYGYWNGDGTETNSGYSYMYGYPSGYLIYDSGCCQVYYDGSYGYYVSDNCGGGCPTAGSYDHSGCVASDGPDASGTWQSGAWIYADFYTDGFCGYYQANQQTNTNGCYYPYGYWLSYSGSGADLNWNVYDSCSNWISGGSYTYSTSSGGDMADGSGGSFPNWYGWSANYGDLIASGSYTDCDSNYYNYNVRYDGSGGYYVETY